MASTDLHLPQTPSNNVSYGSVRDPVVRNAELAYLRQVSLAVVARALAAIDASSLSSATTPKHTTHVTGSRYSHDWSLDEAPPVDHIEFNGGVCEARENLLALYRRYPSIIRRPRLSHFFLIPVDTVFELELPADEVIMAGLYLTIELAYLLTVLRQPKSRDMDDLLGVVQNAVGDPNFKLAREFQRQHERLSARLVAGHCGVRGDVFEQIQHYFTCDVNERDYNHEGLEDALRKYMELVLVVGGRDKQLPDNGMEHNVTVKRGTEEADRHVRWNTWGRMIGIRTSWAAERSLPTRRQAFVQALEDLKNELIELN